MTPVLEIPLSDLLAIVFGFLIRPLDRTDVETGRRESTTVRGEILTLIGTRVVGTVFQVVYASEVLGPVGSVIGEIVIPGEIGSDVPVGRIGIVACWNGMVNRLVRMDSQKRVWLTVVVGGDGLVTV